MEFLGKFIEAVLLEAGPILAAAAAVYLLTLAKKKWAEAKTMYPQVTDQIEWAANLAVKAAEQAGAAKLIESKKAYAIEFATLWLAKQGVKVDVALIEGAIEAKVFEQFKTDNNSQMGFVD